LGHSSTGLHEVHVVEAGTSTNEVGCETEVKKRQVPDLSDSTVGVKRTRRMKIHEYFAAGKRRRL
jgi:hypothetical protein